MQTKNLCAAIPQELHDLVSQNREASGLTTAQYITQILTDYYTQKENGGNNVANTRTMAFQISEELFQKIKSHLELETARTGKKLTQRDFVLGLIETALADPTAEPTA
ncbi:4-oxalocrotonate tautomerase [Bengtsoniella intestinalis]|uniref:4-oxalocrotonate tautomerase n=1 Tax=Bengtsoniella intestinalis TaxID=3073143 RepID=UPI00391F0525